MKVGNAFQGVTKVFLDTAPVIYYVEATVSFFEVVQEAFRRLDEGVFQAVTSPVTLAECLVLPIRLGQTQLQQDFIDLLTATEAIALAPIDAEVSKRAAELRANYGLKLPDALQVGTALVNRCEAFLTNDAMLKQVTELRVLVLGDLEV
jgi:predicted nucleic acid-binding protein